MNYIFGFLILLIHLVLRYIIKWKTPISLLLAAIIASLGAGLPEAWYRLIFALGGTTELILKVAFGVLVIIFLKNLGFFKSLLIQIEQKISNKYFANFLKTILFAFPGMITGSFIVSGMIIKDSFGSLDKDKRYLWFAVFIGVFSPPMNIYYELLKDGLVGGYGFSGYNVFSKIALAAIVLLFISPIFSRKGITVKGKGKISKQINILLFPIVLFTFGELILRPFWPRLVSNQSIHYIILGLLLGGFALYKANDYGQFFNSMINDFRSSMPVLFLILITGFIMSLSAYVGYRGALILTLETLSQVSFFTLVVVSTVVISFFSTQIVLALVAIPALYTSFANEWLFLTIIILIPLIIFIFNKRKFVSLSY